MLPLVLAGGFAWDERTGVPLRTALWTGAFGCAFLGITPWMLGKASASPAPAEPRLRVY